MSTPKFTPGKWQFDGIDQITASSTDADGQPADAIVCKVYGAACDDQDGCANARLIAAAPELFEALDQVMIFADAFAREAALKSRLGEGCDFASELGAKDKFIPTMHSARALLAKVKGETKTNSKGEA